MSQIYLETIINASIARVFDLSRSIDLHKLSAAHTKEEAIAGRTSGLIELGENVTWRAKHLGVYQNLTVQIIRFDRPIMFEDVSNHFQQDLELLVVMLYVLNSSFNYVNIKADNITFTYFYFGVRF